MRRTVLFVVLFATWQFNAVSAAANTEQSTEAVETSSSGISSYYGPDTKHLCFRETQKYNCAVVGCNLIQQCDGSCTDCTITQAHQSDLTSCKHKHVNPEAVFTPGSGNDEDDLTIGTCDWDYDVYKCDPAAPPAGADSACTDPIPLANGAIKLGTAWGTCYLDMGAEHCHPFCGKLALSFQGGLYSMVAYASQGYLLRPACNTTTAGQRSRLSSAAEKAFGASLRSKLEALHHAAVARSASAKHRHHAASNTTITWEVGVATMMSGAITLTSLETRLEYSRGFLDYVVDWSKPTPLETGAAPSKTALVVKPFTYDIVLVGDGQAEY